MNSVRVVYRQDITPEQASDARVRALRFVFDCYAKKKGGVPSTAPNNAKEGSLDDSRATNILPR